VARRARVFVRPPKKSTVWLQVNLGTDVLVGSACALLGSLNAAALALLPFTVVRTRLECRYSTDQSSASETPHGAFGLIVVSDKAAALGITAVPCPITNANDDFFVWQAMQSKFEFTTGTGYRDIGERYTIDSKAMRKMDTGDDIGIVFEQSASVGAEIITTGRILVKLH